MFRWSALAFFLVTGTAGLAVFFTRDRSLVNRWTARLVAVNCLLLGTGVAAPAVASAMRLVVSAVSVSQSPTVKVAVE
jgi:hypothetical protein